MTTQRFVEVHIPGASPERHELLAARQLVGCGPKATIRISPTSAFADVELELFLKSEGVLVRSLQEKGPAVVFGGTAGQTAEVPWGEEVFVQGVRLTFLAGPIKRTGPNPLLLIVAPLVLLVAGFAAFESFQANDTGTQDVDAPSLVDDDKPCPQGTPQDAERDAQGAERAALAKEERFPFEARDGVEAAQLLSEARACFSAAASQPDSARVDAEFKEWTEKLKLDYAAQRLSLRVALDNGRSRDALEAVQGLEALLAARPDSPYRQWLASVHRELDAKVARGRG